jgi:hypothetical protein
MRGDAAVPARADDGLGLLDPAAIALHRGPTGALRATVGGDAGQSHLRVSVYRAFPLSDPGRWVTLCDADGHEIGTVADPQSLEPGSRALLAEELELRYLTPVCTEVVQIREDTTEGGGWSPALVWDLLTDRGAVRMRVPNLADHIRALGPGRYLLQDREGRRVEIDAGALPAESRARLGRFLGL